MKHLEARSAMTSLSTSSPPSTVRSSTRANFQALLRITAKVNGEIIHDYKTNILIFGVSFKRLCGDRLFVE
ncbi:Uncharacterized protein HZ326_15300 [Fusarium oxysporum f. sp. albedinis]|nr:Uncharacterized protein HZ326_15300 [Fusarium oxysporum f. sp. albedinis]